MNILKELNDIFSDIGIPLETGIFSDTAPDEYIVIVPLSDVYELHADNQPNADVQGARISIYSKGSYSLKKTLPSPTESISPTKPTRVITTMRLTWKRTMNWRIFKWQR